MLLVLVAVVALVPVPGPAQNAADLKPTAYAIRDARVVVEPGTVLPKATIVVRDGVIVAVGEDVTVPPDAAVTEGKGLTVYPGFIDAGNTRGYDASLRLRMSQRTRSSPPSPTTGRVSRPSSRCNRR
jgi:imidazolonepropionase-like amidohydrolase